MGTDRLTSRCVIQLCLPFVAAFLFSSSSAASDPITPETLTDEHVQQVIRAFVDDLYSRKDPQRFWDPLRPPRGESTRQEGGYTALAVLALLYAGESYQNPQLIDAIEYLQKFEMRGTYAVSLRAAIWAQLPDKFHDSLVADARWLTEGFSQQTGSWDYVKNPNRSTYDNSIRQFGALALWEADKRDVKVNPRLWQIVEKTLIDTQLENGGWNYIPSSGPVATGSMTAACLATLFITQDLLHAQDAVSITRQPPTQLDVAIKRGMDWMHQHFSPMENPFRYSDYYYYLYAVERTGLAGGLKYFGNHDWYREGAAEIIHRLCEWDPENKKFVAKPQGRRNTTTVVREHSFALLFLSRGRVPVAMNKLQIDGLAWNNRPRDVANITQWITDQTETALAWQVVSMESEPEAWLDAPVLYLASNQALPWIENRKEEINNYVRNMRTFVNEQNTPDSNVNNELLNPPDIPEVSSVKQYLDRGGLLLAVNEGRGRALSGSVELMGSVMYPHYEWRTLPKDHWAYSIYLPVQRARPKLLGLSNGVRELMIISLADMSRTFQGKDTKQKSVYETATNIYVYASEMNRPRPRLDTHGVPLPEGIGEEGDITIVRAIHQGNWNAEPLALKCFASHLQNHTDINLRIIDWPLAQIHELTPITQPTVVLVSGTHKYEFTNAEQESIKHFCHPPHTQGTDPEKGQVIEQTSLVLFENPGGEGAFVDSATNMLQELFPQEPITALINHPIVTGKGLSDREEPIRIGYRPFAIEQFNSLSTPSRLQGMNINGQLRVLLSREDMSHALLDQPCWGISGYTTETARLLLTNILRLALHPPTYPPTHPPTHEDDADATIGSEETEPDHSE